MEYKGETYMPVLKNLKEWYESAIKSLTVEMQ